MHVHKLLPASIVGSALLIAGCTAFRGPPVVIVPQGPVSLTSSTAAPGASPGQIGFLERSYSISKTEQDAISSGSKPAPTAATDPVSVHARQMAIDGANLVDSYCDDFFRTRGDNETVLNVAKDSAAAGGSLASGVLALASPANSVAAGAISLFTSTVTSTLDVYTRNFLFGSDNIESVRAMVVSALGAHRTRAFPAGDTSVWDFGGAVTVIMDHQDLCTPASIRALLLNTVANGKYNAVPTVAASADTTSAAADAASTAAPSTPAVASVAAPAVVAASAPAASAAAAAASAPGATTTSITSAATTAASNAIAPVVQAAFPSAPAQVQQNVTKAIAAVVGSSAAQATQTNAGSKDRHLQIQVVH